MLFFKTNPFFKYICLIATFQTLPFTITLRMTLPASTDVVLAFESHQGEAVWRNWCYQFGVTQV